MIHPLRSRLDRLAVGLVLVTLLAAACGSGDTSPSPSPSAAATLSPSPTDAPPPTAEPSPVDPTAVYDAIEQQVVAIRGLDPTAEVERETIDEQQLGDLIKQMYEEDSPPEYVAANERFYKALGLLPQDESLEDLTLELLSGGVAGFYRNDQKKLYVVSKSGAVGGNEKITFAHEFDHALQDQHFTVFKDQEDVIDQSDRILARQAVYEGDATLLMTLWASQNFSPTDMQDVLAAGRDPDATEMLERMPAILRETLLYPYTTGLTFAQTAFMAGGWAAVDAFYADMPVSTEQILHAEKWQAREAPKKVALPKNLARDLGKGWTLPLEDTFGEFQLGVWLREAGATDATAAAAGWGGDRLGVLEGPGDAWAVAMATDWDSAAEAAEFETAANTAVATLGPKARLLPGAGDTIRWILVASDDATLAKVANVLGLAG
jgi:hypothetical protein